MCLFEELQTNIWQTQPDAAHGTITHLPRLYDLLPRSTDVTNDQPQQVGLLFVDQKEAALSCFSCEHVPVPQLSGLAAAHLNHELLTQSSVLHHTFSCCFFAFACQQPQRSIHREQKEMLRIK